MAVAKKKNKRRRRRKAKDQPHTDTQEATVAHRTAGKTSSATPGPVTPDSAHYSSIAHHAKDKTCANSSQTVGMTPVTHQSTIVYHTEEKSSAIAVTPAFAAQQSNQPAVVDLTTCESVSYEMRDRIPGVKYTKNGSEDWTPVVKRSQRKKSSDHQCPDNSSSDTSGSELDVSCSRMVQYSVREGVPGVSIHRRNVVWKPIVPSPVATRTRSKSKNN